jgi:hypothetical protein
MATIGQQLTAPEAGWKRYDDRNSAIKYTGTWNVVTGDARFYNGTVTWINNPTNTSIRFKFKGTKIRIIGTRYQDRSSNIQIKIDGATETYSEYRAVGTTEGQILVYEKIGLVDGIHDVEITTLSGSYSLDAIDIDSTGRLLHVDEVLDPKDLDIGKRIRCHYQASTSGQVGVFSGLGQETSDFIPPTSSATPSGDFYWICVDRDYLGRWKLIADRNIQHSISWDTLNSAGISSGSGLLISDLKYTSNVCSGGTPLSSGNYSPSNGADKAFDNNSGTWWGSFKTSDQINGEWIGYQFTSPKEIRGIRITNVNTIMLPSIKVEHSDDGITWMTVATLTYDNTANKSTLYSTPASSPKSYWRIVANGNGNVTTDWWKIAEIEMYEESASSKEYFFTIRLLTGGINSSDTDNEWTRYIVNSTLNGTISTPGDNNVWNWNSIYSWTSTTPSGSSSARTVRGYLTAPAMNTGYTTNLASQTIGFRPVLLIESLYTPTVKYLFEDNGEVKKYVQSISNVVPTMTANNVPNPFVVSASSSSSAPYKAFDGSNTTNWSSLNAAPQWLQIKLDQAKVIKQYSITAHNGTNRAMDLKSWTLEGSNDGTSWTILDTQTNAPTWTASEKRIYNINNDNPYLFYRINVSATQTSGAQVGIGEICLGALQTGWTIVGPAPATEEMFLTDGMDDLSTIDDNALQQLVSDTPKLLMWTDDLNKTSASVNLTAVPKGQLIFQEGDIDVSAGVESLNINSTISTKISVGGVALSGGDRSTNEGAQNAFDGNSTTYWISSQNMGTPPYVKGYAWIGYDFGDPVEIAKIGIHQDNLITGVTSVLLQYSDDKVNWTTFTTIDLNPNGSMEYVNITNSPKHRYWRLLANDNPDGASAHWAIRELEFYGATNDIDLKIIASVDQGVTWKTFNGTTWQSITLDVATIKADGMTPSVVNGLTKEQIDDLLQGSNTLRFAYYLEQDQTTDVVNVDDITITALPVAAETPTLDSIKVVYDELTIEGRMQDLERINAINMAKLQFKSNALLQSGKYELHDLVVDTFETPDGVDSTGTNAVYDTSNKEFAYDTTAGAPAVQEVVLQEETLPSYRKKFMLHADHDGDIDYEYSLDGGATWNPITPFTILDLTQQAGTTLKVKAKLKNSAAKLRGVALSWA